MGCAQSTPLSIRDEIIEIERFYEKEKELIIKPKFTRSETGKPN